MKKYLLVILIAFLTSCKTENKNTIQNKNTEKLKFSEKNLAINENYKIGDVRRYGIFPDSAYAYTHPITKEPKINSILDLAEQNGVELFFPKGNYKYPLILDSRENITIKSDKAEFDIIQITPNAKNRKKPKNITIKGTIITFDRLGITEASNIKIDSVIIHSSIEKNPRKTRSRGCHIYHGCNNIKIKYLQIKDFGSGDKRYQNNHAALAIDGWGNNPKNIRIDEVIINSSDRHGVYITGENNVIKKMTIEKYGQGSSELMSGMQDAAKGEEKVLSGLWVNRCNNCTLNYVTVLTKGNNGYALKLDEGKSSEPTIINKIILDVDYKDELILDDLLTNVLVKKIINQ